MSPARLDARSRDDALLSMASEPLDVLVVGGGVVGAGVALDAATRGLKVGLVEAHDFASGTSSNSSKLIHGGLRYLESLELGLVREALRERALILHEIAPHLARTVPFLVPLRGRVWERAYLGAGVLLYDNLGGRRGVPRHRHLSRRGALQRFPGLRPDALVGAVEYHDAQVDDARYTLTLVRTAAQFGAWCATRTRVDELIHEDGRVVGARIVNLVTGEQATVRSRRVVVAAGVWSSELVRGLPAGIAVRASKGVHLVVPRHRIPGDVGVITRAGSSVLLLIPWGDHWLLGTTDTDWSMEHGRPTVTGADVDYLLREANRLLAEPLTREDIVSAYAGLRPLLAGTADSTSGLSREHAVVTPVPGLVLVAGGKYTTYRVMAADAIDAAVRDLPEPAPPSCTRAVRLLGADGFQAAWNHRARTASDSGLPVDQVERLLGRYGTLTGELLELIEREPELRRPIDGAPGYLAVEARYAVLAEGALGLDDVLARRTRIAIETRDRGRACAPDVARIVAPVLGWDEARTAHEVERYLADDELALT